MSTPLEAPTRQLKAVVCSTCDHAMRTEVVPDRCPKCDADIGRANAPIRLVYSVESLQPPRPHSWLETELRGGPQKA